LTQDDSGATGQFIDVEYVEYVQSKNLQVQHLPRAIPVYNMAGTPNEAGHMMDAVDLIVHYKDLCE